ncbi:MAG: hypothetical protein IPP48_07205 [Chitinophagaceae bacterium]|nr:hypothetical protein [Chitinophagaceae bacterium]
MKQFFSFILMLMALAVQATVHTVSNSPTTLAQFNNIQTAVNAAANGDTIYIHGSPNAYFAFTQTNKQLVFIGPGWTPDKNLPFTVSIPGFTITGAGCANSEYQGLVFTSTISINSSKPDNLRFIRNHFSSLSMQITQGGITYSGYLFEGNLFDNSSVDASSSSTYQNFLFQNNSFFENGTARDGNLSGFNNCINVLFDHNLWYGPGSGTRNVTNASVNRFMTFSNNIFVRRSFNTGRVLNSTFNNNITFNSGINNPWANDGNVNGVGNVENQDPQMANQTAVNAGTASSISDFSIAAGPANNSGSDGKDMGFLFDAVGSLNWANSRNSRFPRIFSMNVITPTVPAGGNVTINVDARISN